MKKFYIVMTIAWLILTIAYGVLAIGGTQVPATYVMMPSLLVTTLYFDKIFGK